MISPQSVNERINELKTEFEKGKSNLIELEQQREETRHTMARIDGAIKVLEELLQKEELPKAKEQAEQYQNSEFLQRKSASQK